MIDLSKFLDIAGQVVALAMAASVILSQFSKLEREIATLRYHLESHCQMLNHIGEHLQAKSGYQPIDKSSRE